MATIGSHTHTHALLDRADGPAAAAEVDRSIELIGERLATSCRHFAYPKALLGSPEAEAVVRSRFASAAIGGSTANVVGRTDVHRIARTPIQVSDGLRWFRRKNRGGMRLEEAGAVAAQPATLRIGHDVNGPAAKRAVDVLGAGAALLVSALPMLVVAVVVRLTMGRPVLFRQLRPGLHGRVFEICKFRTMREGTGPDELRLTRVGRFLRSTSLDELPELLNVLRGDMSLVGPRPLLVRYLDRYTPEQARRHDVRPGLTGLAQVAGRNATSWEQRLALDVEYVDTRSFLGDVRIIARTIVMVLRREGISADGHVSMPEFGLDPSQ